MTHSRAACSDDYLKSLLCVVEDSDETRRGIEHVDGCQSCQIRLEQLAADDSVWQEARDIYAEDSSHASLPFAEENAERRSYPSRWNRPSAVWGESMARRMLAPPAHPEMLGQIGRYQVERLIGAGGMGVVFKAHDSELNRPIAIKVLAPFLAHSGAARQRFAREARAAAAVVHEHVVAIHNVETDGESPFLVMQFVAGESLQQRLDREGPLQLCEILRIASQTAAGLAAAHAQGLVHRDVKPSNILLERGVERTLLTDFGLARTSDDASLTHTGFHPGTPQYMSPEQARGDAIDVRSDLFSLGSVIYAMCTGRSPFRAETSYGILRRITDHDPGAIQQVNPEIPQWLEGIVHQLLAKELADRFQSAEKVADLLQRCLAHVQQPNTVELPEECRPLTRKQRMQRTPWRLIVASLACFLLCALAIPIAGDLYRRQNGMAEDNSISGSSTDATATKTFEQIASDFPSESVGASDSVTNETDTVWEAASERLDAYDQDISEFEERIRRNWEETQWPSPPQTPERKQ